MRYINLLFLTDFVIVDDIPVYVLTVLGHST